MFKHAIPVLQVSSAEEAQAFDCGRLGFSLDFEMRLGEPAGDPCYMGVTRDGATRHLSSFSGDGVAGGVVNFRVDDVDALHRELLAKGVAIDSGPVDQTWGNRELYVRDPDGNSLRFQAPL